MKNFAKYTLVCGMIAASASLSAQRTNSGYFLDNYNYRYQLNPAYGNEMNFVSFPVLGNVNLAMRGTLHLTDIVKIRDGKAVLFTNPDVSAASVLNGLNDRSRLGADLSLNILSGGWKAWGGYNTVSIGARASVTAGIPKSFFEIAKNGLENKSYDIKNLDMSARGYADIALNHSRDIKQVPGLRVGAGIHFLLGIANMEAKFDEARITFGDSKWTATTRGNVYANLGGFRFKTKNDNGDIYVDGMDMDGDGSVGINGFGMAFDLGAIYKYRDFTFSAAVLDLGWISYNKTQKAGTDGTQSWDSSDYIFNADESADNSFENEWDKLSDDLGKLYRLNDYGDAGTRTVGVGATLNVGVDYALPYYRRLHFGILSSTRFQERNTWSEVRISANVNPVDCFSATVNGTFGTFGAGFGWLLNFYHKGFSIFVGSDHQFGKLAKQGIPLNSNGSVNFGINFPF